MIRTLAIAALGIVVALASSGAIAAPGAAVRFFGTGENDTDRIKLRIDDPASSADVGAAVAQLGHSCA
ncbi:MAG: hypothetical protein WEE64_07605 [Dehalococcoidia bacterium]